MHEVEAKFHVPSPETFNSIRSQKQIGGYELSDQKIVLLGDTYFDTPHGFLFYHGASLRLREKQGTYLITFKAKTESDYVRTELETEVTASQAQDFLNGHFADVRVAPIQAALAYIETRPLSPVVQVENNRETWFVMSEANQVKVCFDVVAYTNLQGQGICRYAEECELELELQEGDENFIPKLAELLSQQYRLIPNSQSKYERAAALLGVLA
jgi:inorganic triphosphatase YgiF